VHAALPAALEVRLLRVQLRVEAPLAGHALRVHLRALVVALLRVGWCGVAGSGCGVDALVLVLMVIWWVDVGLAREKAAGWSTRSSQRTDQERAAAKRHQQTHKHTLISPQHPGHTHTRAHLRHEGGIAPQLPDGAALLLDHQALQLLALSALAVVVIVALGVGVVVVG